VVYVPGLHKKPLVAEATAVLSKDSIKLEFMEANGLFYLKEHDEKVNAIEVTNVTHPMLLLHHRLAHLNFSAIKTAIKDGVFLGGHLSDADLAKHYQCEPCDLAKAKRMSYKNTKPYHARKPLERLHVDKGGPIVPPTRGGKSHFELFVDEYTRFKWAFLLQHKSETLANFKTLRPLVKRQTGHQIKKLMSDNASEYRSHDLRQYCQNQGIEQLFTNVDSPEENYIAEKPNYTIMNKVPAC
jgi:Integrase core domain/GAG-pre-integrase domain